MFVIYNLVWVLCHLAISVIAHFHYSDLNFIKGYILCFFTVCMIKFHATNYNQVNNECHTKETEEKGQLLHLVYYYISSFINSRFLETEALELLESKMSWTALVVPK